MSTTENKSIYPTTPAPTNPNKPDDRSSSGRNGRALGGIIIVIVGSLLLIDRTGVDLPNWIFSWPMIPIVVGLYIGARHQFKDWYWMIPTGIGTLFLVGHILNDYSFDEFFWPVLIIAFGLVMIFRSKQRSSEAWTRWKDKHNERQAGAFTSDSDFMEVVTIFGGAKKVIISKDFKGGEAVTIFGGAEINFTQADIQGRIQLELVQVFGGAKLIVPANWRIHTDEVVCIFGGIDDKRNPAALTSDTEKVLVLKGTCIFGGIDIKSY
ncbi:MAG TPA: DUF5668 domain-containing protein [Ohtaekwangia sp.]